MSSRFLLSQLPHRDMFPHLLGIKAETVCDLRAVVGYSLHCGARVTADLHLEIGEAEGIP